MTKSAAGTLTLTGNSTYSGGTTVSAGTLAVGPAPFASTSMGTGTVTLSGATLALQGSLASGLTVSLYNNTPSAADPNNGGRDPDFISLTTMNTHFANGASPAVTVLTSTAGKADLNYSSGVAPNDGARAPIFGLTSPTTANYGFPGLDNFEANFNGLITIKTTGDYTFSTRSDDGSVLYLDGNDTPVVDNNFYQGMTTRSGTVHLTAGQHAIALGYYEGGGGLGFDTTYSGPDTLGATIDHSQRGPRAGRESAGGQRRANVSEHVGGGHHVDGQHYQLTYSQPGSAQSERHHAQRGQLRRDKHSV